MKSKRSLIKSIKKKNRGFTYLMIVVMMFFITVDLFSSGAFSYVTVAAFVVTNGFLTVFYASKVQEMMVVPGQANYYGSLPIEINVSWFSQYIAGLQLAMFPVLLESIWIGFSLLISNNAIGHGSIILVTMGVSVVLVWFYYSLSFMVCCFVQNKIQQIVYTIGIIVLPVFLLYSLYSISNMVVVGTNMNGSSMDILYYIPLFSGVDYLQSYIAGTGAVFEHVIGFIIITIIMIVISYWAFCHRKIEDAGDIKSSIGVTILFKTFLSISIAGVFILSLFYMDVFTYYGGLYSKIIVLFCLVSLITSMVLEWLLPNKYKLASFVSVVLFMGISLQLVSIQTNSYQDDISVLSGVDFSIYLSVNVDGQVTTGTANTVNVEHFEEFINENLDRVFLEKQDDSIEIIVETMIYFDNYYASSDSFVYYYVEESLINDLIMMSEFERILMSDYRIEGNGMDTEINNMSTGECLTILDAQSLETLSKMTTSDTYSLVEERYMIGSYEDEQFFVTEEIYEFIKTNQDVDFIEGAMNYEEYLDKNEIIDEQSLDLYCQEHNVEILSYSNVAALKEALPIEIEQGRYSVYHSFSGAGVSSGTYIQIVFSIEGDEVVGIVAVGKVGA
ncbi:hypothetical protein [Tannockella kyphosi]|uniref:hypothetical protein n=1 Tax=Tannockella kyphosi TaxID=2899121 RepID=UPI0020118CE2|nr:hypothetical protein [Tannockella kyphosi]